MLLSAQNSVKDDHMLNVECPLLPRIVFSVAHCSMHQTRATDVYKLSVFDLDQFTFLFTHNIHLLSSMASGSKSLSTDDADMIDPGDHDATHWEVSPKYVHLPT